MMNKMAFIFYLLILKELPVSAQTRQEKIGDYFQALVNNQQFSGNVLVVENDTVVYQKSFGYADHTTGTPNTPNITFPIASITKIFTATAILQLKEKGLLSISEPVNRYLPEFPYPEVTVGHLLSHTSGLPPYNAFFDKDKKENPDRVFTNKDFIPGVVLNRKPLIYQPGEKGNYDNINYLVLALIVEKLSGKTYGNYIKKNILQPAGMKETSLFPLPQQFNRPEIKNYAYPHVYLHLYDKAPVRSNSIPYVKEYWHAYGFRGFADYVSTINDLWKFDQALYKNTLLKQQTLDDAFVPVKLNNGQNNSDNFGLGWEVEKDSSIGKMVYHSGAAMGLSSNILRNVTRHQTVIIFDNTHFNAHENATKLMMLLNDQKVDRPKRSIAKLYGNVLMTKGAAAAREALDAFRKDTANYYLSEDEMNSLGYDFTGNNNPYHLPEQHLYKQAIETFKTNVNLFPNSWNAYDSYAEALLADGQKEEARKMYQRSIELNPKNENGKKVLQQISGR
ncbi:CubicO group peptidase, beta-lactamase class C family [Mucilaginibacter pineti]|uniref:CubicO group peptidase, beta-lactamase class C family n=1 Tax=Mucilaginibacter pineti TaxID=1391627 RepID=A0A1G7IKP7_9SPHI|nr:serine hydrolase [Mucilaginibacter pineti]SDF12869.1 CubicO group peptidase, beta-lactamase class C family [Mucilaginibacter pineti]